MVKGTVKGRRRVGLPKVARKKPKKEESEDEWSDEGSGEVGERDSVRGAPEDGEIEEELSRTLSQLRLSRSKAELERSMEEERREFRRLQEALHSPFASVKEQSKYTTQLKESTPGCTRSTARLPAVELPAFRGDGDLDRFCQAFGRWLRLTGLEQAPDEVKKDWWVSACQGKQVTAVVERVAETTSTFRQFLSKLEDIYPRLENDAVIKQKLHEIPQLPKDPTPQKVAELIQEIDYHITKLSTQAMSEQDKHLLLVSKIPEEWWREMRSTKAERAQTEGFEVLKVALLEKAKDEMNEKLIQQFRRKLAAPLRAEKEKVRMAEALQPKPRDEEVEAKRPRFEASNAAGKGKGMRFQSQAGKGKGRGRSQSQPRAEEPKFQATIYCKFCHKKGHYTDECWSKRNAERRQGKVVDQQVQASSSSSNPHKRKIEEVKVLQRLRAFQLYSVVDGRKIPSTIDTGATTSILAKKNAQGKPLDRKDVKPVRVGDGRIQWTEGSTEVEVMLGKRRIKQRVLVMETEAFELVLGMDFLGHDLVEGILFRPWARIVVGGEEYPLEEVREEMTLLRRIYHTESYKLDEEIRKQGLQDLNIEGCSVDLFAEPCNAQEVRYITKKQNAWTYHWGMMSQGEPAWANPPFSRLLEVVHKIIIDQAKVVLCTPDWGKSGTCGKWRGLLDRITIIRVPLPEGQLYIPNGSRKRLPSPQWGSMLSLVDGKRVDMEELDQEIVKKLSKLNKGRSFEDLEGGKPSQKIEVEEVDDPRGVSQVQEEKKEVASHQEPESTGDEGAKEVPRGEEPLVPSCDVSTIAPEGSMSIFLAELVVQGEEEGEERDPEGRLAKPTNSWPIGRKDIEGLCKGNCSLGEEWSEESEEKLCKLEVQVEEWEEEKSKSTGNLKGKDLEELLPQHPEEVHQVLREHEEVFGELPDHKSVKKLVTMDLKLKPEWEGVPLKCKPYPLSASDQKQQDEQIEELLAKGLIEEYLGTEFPQYCSPTFMIPKKNSEVKRLTVDYKRLNARTEQHVGSLPNMEVTLERLAGKRWKSKMDKRSGFWQVALSERAKELGAFMTARGRIFRPCVMNFGFSNAAPIFQELMNKILAIVRRRKSVQPIMERGGVLECHVDDAGLGTDSVEDHLVLLREFLAVCQENHIRVRLEKCEFLKEHMEYLGFDIGWGWWRPSEKKVLALKNAQVRNSRELASFLGACNFFRRHIRNFTATSAELSDLTKKNSKWEWTDRHQKLFDELKEKMASLDCLGTPRALGEFLTVTDACQVGGGATLFQWQWLCTEEVQALPDGLVTGVNRDGTLKTNNPGAQWVLVPIGHWNWKWNDTRRRYGTYEQELLAGVLVLASQTRLLNGNRVVWLCDQKAVETFMSAGPPENPRLVRWWTFLSQLRLKVLHLPGCKNELDDYISRNNFEEKYQVEWESLAEDAFARMDVQLDLGIEEVALFQSWRWKDYEEEHQEVLDELQGGTCKLLGGDMWLRSGELLYKDKLIVVPEKRIGEVVHWAHNAFGHPGVRGTVWELGRRFAIPRSSKEIWDLVDSQVRKCQVCVTTKGNTQVDRGLVGALPIPSMVNIVVYLDFIEMDRYANKDYVMLVTCALSRFTRVWATTKKITSEGSLKIFFEEWVQVYGLPTEVHHDNDVRWTSETGWWRGVLRALGCRISPGVPRRPESNGVAERRNGEFLKMMRGLVARTKSKDWIRLVPYAVWLMNTRASRLTGLSPAEVFLGRPMWTMGVPNQSEELQSSVEDWLVEQMELQGHVAELLRKQREKEYKKRNTRRLEPRYKSGDFVLVHKNRFPRFRPRKLGSQWFGPYRVVDTFSGSVKVRASPKLGGEVIVGHSHLKIFPVEMELEEDLDMGEGEEELAKKDEELGQEEEEWEVVGEELEEKSGKEEPKEKMTQEEMRREGFYIVKKILKHKYEKGWRFLVLWDHPYTLADATWEPISSFVLEKNKLNEVFEEYCQEKKLEDVLSTARRRAQALRH